MAGFGEHMSALSFGLSNLDPALTLSHAIQGQAFRGLACLHSIHAHHGEHNRYSKEHQRPISIDHVPVQIPLAVRDAKCSEYKHSRLTEGDQIRLLELLPTTWSKSPDFIACRLVTKKLSGKPPYEALSYTWGTLAREVPMFVVPHQLPSPLPDGFVVCDALLMTPQLYAALKRLRWERVSRFLWVDQICIDQTNNKERGEQVLLMDKIYQQSIQTIVWLGEEDEYRAPVEEMLGFLTTDQSNTELDAEIVKNLLAADRGVGKRRQEAITHLLNRDWFTRAWIFQEAVLSKRLLLKCGGMEVSFDKFKRLIDGVMRVQYDWGGYARSLLKTTVGFDTVDLIQHGRTSCDDESCQRLVDTNFLTVLFEALQQFRATNPRDLIYAFLAPRFQSLQLENRIIPDYDKAVEWVWIDAARRIIADTGSLDILAAARGGEQGDFHVPSWVPDWSYCFRYARPITAPGLKTSFEACRGRKHIMEQPPDDYMVLRVRGKIIYKIAWLAPRNFEVGYYRDGMTKFLDLDGHVGALSQHLGFQRGLRAEGVTKRWPNLKGEVLRTLLADGSFGHIQPLPEKTKDLERVLGDESNIMDMKRRMDAGEHVPNPNRWRGDYELLEKLWGWGLIVQKKVMFVTKTANSINGQASIKLGLAASSVQVNDVVVLLHGSKVPIVLRSAVENRWTVISQCYLEGCMFGKDDPATMWWKEEDADSFVLV